MTSLAARAVFVAANASIDRLLEVDRIEPGAIHRPDRVVAVAGGKGLNAARAAAALGGRVSAVALVGGRAGEWIGEQLVAAGIETAIVRTEGETRTCVSVFDRATGRLTEFYEPGEPIAPGAWQELERAVGDAARDAAIVVLSGSLPPGAPSDGYARLIAIARRAGAATLVDAAGAALAAALAERPAVVKVNAREAAEAAGVDPGALSDTGGARDVGRRLLAAGAAAAVITLGAAGAVVVEDEHGWSIVPPDVRGDYPVGSGDAVSAGIAIGLARGQPLLEAVRLGVAAGIANALVPGPGLLAVDRIEGLLDGVRARPI